MKNSYEIRAQRFIHKIHPYLEGLEIDNPNYLFVHNSIEKYNEEHHRNVKIDQGASRYVLITSDYVVKIDKYSESGWGTSKNEVIAYKKAKECGMSHLLAKITPYEYGGRIYYIMPKVLLCKNNGPKTMQARAQLNREESNFIIRNFYDLHKYNTGLYNNHYVLLDYAANYFK